jgi:hypothetical protein
MKKYIWKANEGTGVRLVTWYFQIIFEGVRPEDCRLHAIYIAAASE